LTKNDQLAIDLEEYKETVKYPEMFREWLDENAVRWPELFPVGIKEGYVLHDMRRSKCQRSLCEE
jgi:hypothetical protein